VQFEAEPTVVRWIFFREGADVWVQLLRLPDRDRHDKAGFQIWSSWQTVDTIARAFISGFDAVAAEYGESRYQDKWGHPFPSTELEKLRAAWRQHHGVPGSVANGQVANVPIANSRSIKVPGG